MAWTAKNHPGFELFTDAMKVKLEDNSHKLEKPKLPIPALLKKLRIEVEELAVALEHETEDDAAWECVDVANFAMLIWKRLKGPGYTIPGKVEEPAPIRVHSMEDVLRQAQLPGPFVTGMSVLRPEDFEPMGWWNPTEGEMIYMFRHKLTGTVYYEETERTRNSSLPIVNDSFRSKIPRTS